MALPTAPGGKRDAGRSKVAVYENTLGSALRGAGRNEFGTTFDKVPLNVILDVPAKVANDLGTNGFLLQQVGLTLGPLMQRHVSTYIAPLLTPGVAANVGAIEATIAARSKELVAPIEAVIQRHYQTLGEWEKLRRDNLIEGSIIAVTLTLTVVGFALAPTTAGVSAAAAFIGMARGAIDGIALLRTCWISAAEALIKVEKEIASLNAYHDQTGAAGAGAAQVAGGLLRAAGPGKLVAAVANKDLLPSIASIETGLNVCEGKVGHLYAFLNRMTETLSRALREQQAVASSSREGQRAQELIQALLETGVSGKRSGFRDSYTIATGFEQYQQSTALIRKYKQDMATLRSRDPNAKATAIAVKSTEVVTNLGFSAINYPSIFNNSSAPAAEIFGVSSSSSPKETINASFGMFNDAVGVLKEIVGVAGEVANGAEAESAEREVRLAFSSTPSAIVPVSGPSAVS